MIQPGQPVQNFLPHQ